MVPDFDMIECAKQRLRDVWAYRPVDHIPVFIRISDKLGHSRREIVEDPDLQFQINRHNLSRSLRTLPDDYIPYARVWLGYMTIATMFGLQVHWGDDPDQSPGVEQPLITDDIDMVYSLAKPDARTDGLMRNNLDLLRVFLERFPEWVYLTGFDLGGPLNSCRDLVETEHFYTAMIEQPEPLHYLLSLLADLQIECYQATIEVAGGTDRLTCIDMAQIWAPPGHKGFVSDDVCATISPAMFETYSMPYNNRIFARWPGGLLHNCGPHPSAVHYLDHTPPINGINCSYRYTRDDLPRLGKTFAGRGLIQAVFDNGESAQEMLDGFYYMMETLAPETVGTPVPIVDDTWSDAKITEFYHEMREIGTQYAANMRWRDGGDAP
jgi:uroporphyrinogen-III decarboxylase